MSLAQLKKHVAQAVGKTYGRDLDLGRFEVERTSGSDYGDFATNAALVYAKELKRPPRQLAEDLAEELRQSTAYLTHVEVAGPGFINMSVSDSFVCELAKTSPSFHPTGYSDQVIVVEYSDPNPFKVLHVGHLYTSVVGDAIANLIRAAGGRVHPVNFGGDVGLHVARAMWAISRELGGMLPDGLEEIKPDQRSTWMAKCYVAGTKAYEDDDSARQAIIDLNKQIYAIHENSDHDSPTARVYWTCRQWSYDYFDRFYARIGSTFEKYYPESQTTPLGLEIVRRETAKGVYAESQGAIIFDGEPYGLHARVFITSQGLPTYEAKDVGLIAAKWRDYHFDRSVIITANDIIDYMKVVLKSIEQFAPEMALRTTHITHGNVKLAGGTKMSSRKGNFIGATDVLDLAEAASKRENGQADDTTVLGAVKYAFLRARLGADIVYLPEESVSLEGNSGPYLQYAHARARSILRKAGNGTSGTTLSELDAAERAFAMKIGEYPEVLQKSVNELLPHHICTYLYETAQIFNRFYEGHRVMGDPRQEQRLILVRLYADVLKSGLNLLGITAPEQM